MIKKWVAKKDPYDKLIEDFDDTGVLGVFPTREEKIVQNPLWEVWYRQGNNNYHPAWRYNEPPRYLKGGYPVILPIGKGHYEPWELFKERYVRSNNPLPAVDLYEDDQGVFAAKKEWTVNIVGSDRCDIVNGAKLIANNTETSYQTLSSSSEEIWEFTITVNHDLYCKQVTVRDVTDEVEPEYTESQKVKLRILDWIKHNSRLFVICNLLIFVMPTIVYPISYWMLMLIPIWLASATVVDKAESKLDYNIDYFVPSNRFS